MEEQVTKDLGRPACRCTLRAGIFRRMALDMRRVGHDFLPGPPLRVMENEGAWDRGLRRIQGLVSSIWHVLPEAFGVFCSEPGSEGSQVQ